ncbi:hypothetical protein K1X76_02280 [bacterium]|nr:hypothetical protein [bacterium]
MSLKFFFNRHGNIVRILSALGVFLFAYNLYHLKNEWAARGHLTVISYLVMLVLAIGIYFCNYFPWYSKSDRGWGIEEHFEKTIVPTGYILVLTNLAYCVWLNPWPLLWAVIFMFALILSVNFILIYFHFKDKSSDPPSLFVRNFHLKEKK